MVKSLFKGDINGREFQSPPRLKVAHEEAGARANSDKGCSSDKCYISTNTEV